MKKTLFFQFLFISITVAVLAQNKEERSLIIETINTQDQKFIAFYKNSQADSLAGLFSPNCHVAREFGTIIEGRENVQSLYKNDFKSGIKVVDFSFNVLEQKVYDDLVLEIGTNNIAYTKGPNKILYKETYNYMFVWKKSKSGNYQIRSAIWNSTKNPCN